MNRSGGTPAPGGDRQVPHPGSTWWATREDKLLWQKLLLTTHRGEIVEVGRSTWTAQRGAVPKYDRRWNFPQFDIPPPVPGAAPAPGGAMREWANGKEEMAGRWQPNWERQVNKWLAPDAADPWSWHWARSCRVSTLPELWLLLGGGRTAAEIYDWSLYMFLLVGFPWGASVWRRTCCLESFDLQIIAVDMCMFNFAC